MKALLLAAGYGTRLRPITETVPKPLIPILNVSLLDIALRQLQASGLSEFALNAHHLAHKIEGFADEKRSLGLNVTVSVERPDILGTGGVFAPLRGWISGQDILVYNGDILSDIDFFALMKRHREAVGLVTMAVRPGHNGRDRAVWAKEVLGSLEVVAISKEPPKEASGLSPFTFACAYVTKPELFDFLPTSGEADVVAGFTAALAAGFKIGALVHSGYWADVGNPRSLWTVTNDALVLAPATRVALFGKAVCGPKVMGHGVFWSETAQAKGLVVLGNHSAVAAHAVLENVILLPGAKIGHGEHVSSCIVTELGEHVAF